jgi:hypothetical protein
MVHCFIVWIKSSSNRFGTVETSRAGGILEMEAGDDESGVPPVGQPRRSL